MPILNRNKILAFVNGLVVDHPTPVNISYLWNFGSLAALALVSQILSGLFLAMHYVPNLDYAFLSIEHIMRDVNGGWMIRYLHANGASFFFLCVYIHIFRGLYFGTYLGKNAETWFIGVTMYIFTMATAFLGYVLPWGQMSLWGATVITNFLSVIPFIGVDAVQWLWGGFSVNNATLNRFYSLHFFLPFCLAGLLLLHLIALHNAAHSNPLGINKVNFMPDSISEISFYPYFIAKDAVGIFIFILLLAVVLVYYPNLLGHTDNYINANPLSTPPHIVPEWYFLPFYAILRSIPSKTVGVLAMFISIIALYFIPYLNYTRISSAVFRIVYRFLFWIFVFTCLLLGWVGGNPVEAPFYTIGQIFTSLYFGIVLIGFPCFNVLENSISTDIRFSIDND